MLLLAGAVALALAAPDLLADRALGSGGPSAGASGQQPVEVVQTTADLSNAMTRLHDLSFSTQIPAGVPVIHVDDQLSYQRIEGFGAAMTDTSAYLLYNKLSPSTRASVISQLFGAGGIRLNFLRVPIGASDFTRGGRPYSYDDMPPGQSDPSLVHFSIAHDLPYIIPAIRQVLGVSSHVELLANPWSPPGWMKANDSLDNRNHHGTLLSSAYQPLAKYFVRFLSAYAARGIRIDAIGLQNEPGTATIYPGMELDSSEESNLISNYLVPALQAAGLAPKIYGGEVGWARRGQAFSKSLAASPAATALAGISRHCYSGEPTVMGSFHNTYPQIDQILEECSTGAGREPPSEMVIAAMRNWASLVATWNLALDPQGGPVQPPNQSCGGCTGLITVRVRSHSAKPGLDYFQLGQASAFVRQGAHRIASDHLVTYGPNPGSGWQTPGVDDVAFLNPDGSRVLLAYNSASVPVRFAVQWRGEYFVYRLAPKATVTFEWGAGG